MQILIELDQATFRRLEAAAPAKSRRRSAFIRAAIQRALWELEEEKTRQAYLTTPDHEAPAFDATAWEPLPHGGFDAPDAPPRVRRTRSAKAARVRKGGR